VIRRLARFSVLLSLFLALDGYCADYGFRILKAELVPSGPTYVLNADIDYRFSEPAIEALRHGVPLTLVVHLKIKRHRRYWLDETVLAETRRLRIRYHPLARSFQIVYEDNGITENFAGLTTLLEQMGTIRDWSVPGAERLEKGQEYRASLAVSLDIEALPLPLRPIAYISPSWYLGSSWYQWRVAG
jgi:hypothetical protein